jgi:hypothetical protein
VIHLDHAFQAPLGDPEGRCVRCDCNEDDHATFEQIYNELRRLQKDKEATASPSVKKCRARRFILQRAEDATGTSGTGVVAEGVCFSGGKVALNWYSHYSAMNVYDTIQVVLAIHGHEGRTRVVWLDPEVL